MSKDAGLVSNMMAISNPLASHGETELLINSEENVGQAPDFLATSNRSISSSGSSLKNFDWESAARSEMIDEIERQDLELKSLRARGKYLAQELDLFRQRRAIFWSDRFRNNFNAWSLVS